jgi:L-2-hydroxyglutarate oxidase LhgO
MSVTRSRHTRALAAGALSAALLSTGTAGAVAATGTPAPKPTMTRTGMPSMKPSRTPTAMGSITVSANRKAVKVGNTVVFTGRVKGIKAGSTLVLQHRHNGKWTTLKTTAVVNKNGTYTIKRTFTKKGTEQVRVATKSGTFHSSPLTVQVS